MYQTFLPNGTWNWSDTNFWIDAWVYIDDTDALQHQAEFSLGIRCIKEFYGTKTVVGKAFSTPLTVVSPLNVWTRVWTEVGCSTETSLVEAVVRFKQPTLDQDSTDHGAVYVDDLTFGIY